jgi:hypothetical protein
MRREIVHSIATSLLAACATAPSDGAPYPPVTSYNREFLARAADGSDVQITIDSGGWFIL